MGILALTGGEKLGISVSEELFKVDNEEARKNVKVDFSN